MKKLIIFISLFLMFACSPAHAVEYGPYRAKLDLNYKMKYRIYDADTFYAVVDIWPKDHKGVSVRVKGYDAAEMFPKKKYHTFLSRKCEMDLARVTRKKFIVLLTSAKEIILTHIKHDPYYGRVDAVVLIDGVDIADLMLATGLVRKYGGEKRKPWCVK